MRLQSKQPRNAGKAKAVTTLRLQSKQPRNASKAVTTLRVTPKQRVKTTEV
jgi:hypothetical protein